MAELNPSLKENIFKAIPYIENFSAIIETNN